MRAVYVAPLFFLFFVDALNIGPPAVGPAAPVPTGLQSGLTGLVYNTYITTLLQCAVHCTCKNVTFTVCAGNVLITL